MKIYAITSWGGACGIANFCEQLIEAVRFADPAIDIIPSAEALDPNHHEVRSLIHDAAVSGIDIVYLNYHRGLHSRWTPERVQELKQSYKVVIDFHDSVGERPPDALTQALHDLADAFVVHEPCEGLPKQILIRQGVPALQAPRVVNRTIYKAPPPQTDSYPSFPELMPILGTVGFNFPWKNFDRLASVTAEAGWAYLVCSNNATREDVARWTAANPYTYVVGGFQPTEVLVQWLSTCDATCFAYECANSGTSGAIRLGIAARKPVLAFRDCRQFRDLREDDQYRSPYLLQWPTNWADIAHHLRHIPIQRVDPGIAYLAHRDSWTVQGAKYAAIFKGLAG